jgi:hypothetical protein
MSPTVPWTLDTCQTWSLVEESKDLTTTLMPCHLITNPWPPLSLCVHTASHRVPLRHHTPLTSEHLLDTTVDLPTHQVDATTRRPQRTPTSASSSCALHTTSAGQPLCTRSPLPSTSPLTPWQGPEPPVLDAPVTSPAMTSTSRSRPWSLYKQPSAPWTSPHHPAASLPPS